MIYYYSCICTILCMFMRCWFWWLDLLISLSLSHVRMHTHTHTFHSDYIKVPTVPQLSIGVLLWMMQTLVPVPLRAMPPSPSLPSSQALLFDFLCHFGLICVLRRKHLWLQGMPGTTDQEQQTQPAAVIDHNREPQPATRSTKNYSQDITTRSE